MFFTNMILDKYYISAKFLVVIKSTYKNFIHFIVITETIAGKQKFKYLFLKTIIEFYLIYLTINKILKFFVANCLELNIL